MRYTDDTMSNYAFIDASNLFYGGKKSLGWSIDYEKLKTYLSEKYGIAKVFYFGGVDIHQFPFNYLEHETVPLRELKIYIEDYLTTHETNLTESKLLEIRQHLKRIRFYIKLEQMGYTLILKPVKIFNTGESIAVRKANCDVDMTFYMMRERNAFDKILVLTGDGDFLPVLKYLREKNKQVLILSRSERTAKEIKQFAGDKFMDFNYLRERIKIRD